MISELGLSATQKAAWIREGLKLAHHRVLIGRCDGASGGPLQLRRLAAALPGIPIVVCMSRAGRAELWEAQDAGVKGYLIQPLSSDQLLDALGALADRRAGFCPRGNELLLQGFWKLGGGGGLRDILSPREYQVVACSEKDRSEGGRIPVCPELLCARQGSTIPKAGVSKRQSARARSKYFNNA